MMRMQTSTLWAGGLAILLMQHAFAGTDKQTHLALSGKPQYAIVVSGAASPATQSLASELAEYLGKITGGTFAVRSGDGKAGIVIGRQSDFPSLGYLNSWDINKPEQRESYLLQSHPNGLRIIGATDLAVSHAVWALLYRLGYRQYFPGRKWEVIPVQPNLSILVDVHEQPSYQARMIWYEYGRWDFAAEAQSDWNRKNRVGSALKLYFPHVYQDIYARNKKVFDQHPEYLCHDKINPKKIPNRFQVKFRISNPGLRRLVIEDSLRQVAAHPEFDNISMEPSDNGGWCEKEDLPQLAAVSDRVIFLANEVAAAINENYSGKLVSLNAYNFHAPPPSIQANPQVLVNVATGLTRGGYTIDELIEGWSAATKRLGIREYYSVNMWDHDMPAKGRASNIDYLKRTIPEFHAKGARVYSAQSGDNWGAHGLGYYLAARMLWDVNEAQNADALIEDFLINAFGSAKEPMREFYRQLDGSKPHLVISDQLGRMYRALDQARQLASNPEVAGRLDDLVLYARYVDLYQRYLGARGDARQEAVDNLLQHAYRMRASLMVHTKVIPSVLASKDKSVAIFKVWGESEKSINLKSIQPINPEELADFVREGIARYPLPSSDY